MFEHLILTLVLKTHHESFDLGKSWNSPFFLFVVLLLEIGRKLFPMLFNEISVLDFCQDDWVDQVCSLVEDFNAVHRMDEHEVDGK